MLARRDLHPKDLETNIKDLETNIYGRPTLHIYRHEFPDMPSYADAVEKSGGLFGNDTGDDVLRLAREGWPDHAAEAMEVAARAVRMVETEVQQAEPFHDVSGADVDMGAYMSGEPECMVEYPFTKQSNLGYVITMMANVQCNAAVSNRAIQRRGYVITGLAMALNRLGHQTDLWVSDEYCTRLRPTERMIIRTHVKSPNDFIDPARIMFAFAHPGVQRGMGFGLAANEKGYDGYFGQTLLRGAMGDVPDVTRDMPEGTIYIPPMFRESDSMNTDVELRRYLVQLGLLEGADD